MTKRKPISETSYSEKIFSSVFGAMSRSDWMEFTPLGVGLIVIFGLVLVAETHSHNIDSSGANFHVKKDDSGEYNRQSKEFGGAISAIHEKASTNEYQANCNKKADADLCAQRRMAVSAEKQAWFTEAGFYVLMATFIAAAIAAFEARRISRITDSSAKHQLRAYITIKGGGIRVVPVQKNTWLIRWEIELFNSGQTPAYKFRTAHRAGVFSFFEGKEPDLTLSLEDLPESIVGPGQSARIIGEKTVSEVVINGIRQNSWHIHIAGRATFRDVFGQDRFFGFKCQRGDLAENDCWSIGPTEQRYTAN